MVRYADLVCDGCGAIYPANEMVHTTEELGSESYISNSYVTHRGGGQTIYSTVETRVVLCKACAEARKPEPPSKLVGFLLNGAALVVGGVILAPMVILGLMIFRGPDQPTDRSLPSAAHALRTPDQSAPSGPAAEVASTAPAASNIAAPKVGPDAADSTGPGPSFDCGKASADVERLICSSPDLARADVKLMDAYKERMALLPAESPEQLALRQEQRTWLTEQRDRCATGVCVAAAYAARTQALSEPIGER